MRLSTGMSTALIIINAEVNEHGAIVTTSPATKKMVAALKQTINTCLGEPVEVKVVAAALLSADSDNSSRSPELALANSDAHTIYCPLTIQLPSTFDFPARLVFQACKDVESRRRWVHRQLQYQIGLNKAWLGDLWLPIVLTAKGPLYGEVIGEGAVPNSYEQPIDLADDLRQSLYHLAYELLQSISALPAVYLMQFTVKDRAIVFDRLWPFPAAPAIASLTAQYPDLFTCHWHCLTQQPILDLTVHKR